MFAEQLMRILDARANKLLKMSQNATECDGDDYDDGGDDDANDGAGDADDDANRESGESAAAGVGAASSLVKPRSSDATWGISSKPSKKKRAAFSNKYCSITLDNIHRHNVLYDRMLASDFY
jgi:hypothetical protein